MTSPLDRECPTCGALAGRYCVGPSGRTEINDTHPSRLPPPQEPDAVPTDGWDDVAKLGDELRRTRAICLAVRDKLIKHQDKAVWELAFELNYACGPVEEPST